MHHDLLKESILNAIYGGPHPRTVQIRQFLQEWKIPLPGDVTAYSERAAFSRRKAIPPVSAKGTVFLRLHAGTLYQFHPAKYETPPFPKFHYCRPEDFIWAVQQAILALRQKELNQLDQTASSRKEGRASFTLQEEGEAFRLAIQAILKTPEEAWPTVEVWGRIVLHRYQKYLHSIHLKFIELITALTHGQDLCQTYPCYALIARILSTYPLRELAKFPHIIMKEIGPLARPGHLHGTVCRHSPAVEKAFLFMEASFDQSISLAQVAQASHVSSAHLSRLFKQETGRSVVEHLHRLRIHRAMELLATTPRSLLEIALDCGFESIEHFHRLFRRHTGTTPRAYRLQSQNAFTKPLADSAREH